MSDCELASDKYANGMYAFIFSLIFIIIDLEMKDKLSGVNGCHYFVFNAV